MWDYEREAQTGQKTSEVSVQSRGHWTKQEWLGGGRNKTGTAAVRNTEALSELPLFGKLLKARPD